MNIDFFDLYHVVVKALPWPEDVEKWGEAKPSQKHALDALRKLGSQGVSAADKLDPLIERVLASLKTGPSPAVQRGTFAKPDDEDEEKPVKHSKAHH